MRSTRRSTAGTFVLAALGLLLVSSGAAVLVAASTASAEAPIHKSYVCKYVKKPGAFELMQTGQNPIWVDNHSLVGQDVAVNVGDRFSDGQFLSVVIVANTARLDPEPGLDQCPQLEPPPPIPVVAAAPAFTDPTCPAPAGSVQVPATEGVSYSQSGTAGPGQTVTVTATALTGYVLTGTAAWSHTFAQVPQSCTQVLPPEVEPPARPPAVAPPQAAPPVTPRVVHAGYGATLEASTPADPGLLGLGLLAAGLLVLAGAGAGALSSPTRGR